MAPGNMAIKFGVVLAVLLANSDLAWGQATGNCKIDASYLGDWYSMEVGRDVFTPISADRWGKLICLQRYNHTIEGDFVQGINTTMLMKNGDGGENCFYCMDVLWRTDNILQYKLSGCLTSNSGFENMCKGIKQLPTQDQTVTLFKQTLVTVNCITTWEGVYQFTYEVNWGGGGICDNPDNLLKACQDPGSPYVDNQVFMMTYARCPNVQTSKSKLKKSGTHFYTRVDWWMI